MARGPLQLLFLAIAFAAGLMISLQPAVNSRLGRALGGDATGGPFLAPIANFSVGLTIGLIVVLIRRPEIPTLEQITNAPWWAWCGGVIGATMVTTTLLLAPRLGAVLLILALVCGQIIGSGIWEHFGFAGYPKSPLTLVRTLGIAMVIIGVLVVRWDSTRTAAAAVTAADAPVSAVDVPDVVHDGSPDAAAGEQPAS